MNDKTRPMTVPRFVRAKQEGRKLTMLTCYDYSTAVWLDQAGVDSILVGDSLGMVMQGNENTLPVTVEEIIYHTKCVCRGVRHALVIADLPFPINHLGIRTTIEVSARILKETGCQAIKLEGGQEQAETIAALVAAGIPVMGHIGLRPQNVLMMGGYKIERDGERLGRDASAVQSAGAFGVVLEGVPSSLASEVTAGLTIPTIGIGAGADCDGQVLVLHDMLGMNTGHVPKFAKAYAEIGKLIKTATEQYCLEVQGGIFPGEEHSY